MKTIRSVLIFTAIVCAGLSCTKSDSLIYENDSSLLKNGAAMPGKVTIPFKADFTGNYDAVDVDALCGEYPWVMVKNTGGGNGTLLGKFTHYFEFCCDFSTGIYPADHMMAFFTAANGDILYVYCSGQVMAGRLEDHPADVIEYFRDPWVILGGTGRFEGATGSGWTNDWNSSLDPYSHHHWRGTITLVNRNNQN